VGYHKMRRDMVIRGQRMNERMLRDRGNGGIVEWKKQSGVTTAMGDGHRRTGGPEQGAADIPKRTVADPVQLMDP